MEVGRWVFAPSAAMMVLGPLLAPWSARCRSAGRTGRYLDPDRMMDMSAPPAAPYSRDVWRAVAAEPPVGEMASGLGVSALPSRLNFGVSALPICGSKLCCFYRGGGRGLMAAGWRRSRRWVRWRLGSAGPPKLSRRRTGIEPARDRFGLSPVLKTGEPTRRSDASLGYRIVDVPLPTASRQPARGPSLSNSRARLPSQPCPR